MVLFLALMVLFLALMVLFLVLMVLFLARMVLFLAFMRVTSLPILPSPYLGQQCGRTCTWPRALLCP